jgi:hypothetical protein
VGTIINKIELPQGYFGMTSTDIAHQRPFPMVVMLATSLWLLNALCGCAGAGTPAADTTQHAESLRAMQMTQVIIKFRDPKLNPAEPGYLNELSRDVGVALVFVRPMSGGAYVLRVEGKVDNEQFQQVVHALAKRSDVEYAEPDRRVHHMPQD